MGQGRWRPKGTWKRGDVVAINLGKGFLLDFLKYRSQFIVYGNCPIAFSLYNNGI